MEFLKPRKDLSKKPFLTKIICRKILVCVILLLTFVSNTLVSPVYGQNLAGLVQDIVQQTYNPLVIRGISFDVHNPFHFDFIVDTGNTGLKDQQEIKKQTQELIEYFLIGLTVPEQDLWVNLSLYEENHVLPESLNKTAMGKNFLDQDFLLKKLTSSATMPDSKEGGKLWQTIYKKVYELCGTTKVPVDIINKVWIVPGEAEVMEYHGKAFVTKATLKVMMEEDYVALRQTTDNRPQTADQNAIRNAHDARREEINKISVAVMKEQILPLIEKEINNSKEFAALRQMYYSLVLATYWKGKLKQSIHYLFINQKKLQPLQKDEADVKEKIYQEYIQLYKMGIYDYIKREYDSYEKKYLKRRYVSGGLGMEKLSETVQAFEPLNDKYASSAMESSRKGQLYEIATNWQGVAEERASTAPASSSIEELGEKYDLDRMRKEIMEWSDKYEREEHAEHRFSPVSLVVANHVLEQWGLKDHIFWGLRNQSQDVVEDVDTPSRTAYLMKVGVSEKNAYEIQGELIALTEYFTGNKYGYNVVLKSNADISKRSADDPDPSKGMTKNLDRTLNRYNRFLWLNRVMLFLGIVANMSALYFTGKSLVLMGVQMVIVPAQIAGGVQIEMWLDKKMSDLKWEAKFGTQKELSPKQTKALTEETGARDKKESYIIARGLFNWIRSRGMKRVDGRINAARGAMNIMLKDLREYIVNVEQRLEFNEAGDLGDIKEIYDLAEHRQTVTRLQQEIKDMGKKYQKKLVAIGRKQELVDLLSDFNVLKVIVDAIEPVELSGRGQAELETIKQLFQKSGEILEKMARREKVNGLLREMQALNLTSLSTAKETSTMAMQEPSAEQQTVLERLEALLKEKQELLDRAKKSDGDSVKASALSGILGIVLFAGSLVMSIGQISWFWAIGMLAAGGFAELVSHGIYKENRERRPQMKLIEADIHALQELLLNRGVDQAGVVEEKGSVEKSVSKQTSEISTAEAQRLLDQNAKDIDTILYNLSVVLEKLSQKNSYLSYQGLEFLKGLLSNAEESIPELIDTFMRNIKGFEQIQEQGKVFEYINTLGAVQARIIDNNKHIIELLGRFRAEDSQDKADKELYNSGIQQALAEGKTMVEGMSESMMRLKDTLRGLRKELNGIETDQAPAAASDDNEGIKVRIDERLAAAEERSAQPVSPDELKALHEKGKVSSSSLDKPNSSLEKQIKRLEASIKKLKDKKDSALLGIIFGSIGFTGGLLPAIISPKELLLDGAISLGAMILGTLGVVIGYVRYQSSKESIQEAQAELAQLKSSQTSKNSTRNDVLQNDASGEESEHFFTVIREQLHVVENNVKLALEGLQEEEVAPQVARYLAGLLSNAYEGISNLTNRIQNNVSIYEQANRQREGYELLKRLAELESDIFDSNDSRLKMLREFAVEDYQNGKTDELLRDGEKILKTAEEKRNIKEALREHVQYLHDKLFALRQEISGDAEAEWQADTYSETAIQSRIDDQLEAAEYRGSQTETPAELKALREKGKVSSSSLSLEQYDVAIQKRGIRRNLGIGATILGSGLVLAPAALIFFEMSAVMFVTLFAAGVVAGGILAAIGIFSWVNNADKIDSLKRGRAALKRDLALRAEVPSLPEVNIDIVKTHFKENIKSVVARIRLLQRYGIKGNQRTEIIDSIRENIDALSAQIDTAIERFERELIMDSEKETLLTYKEVLRNMKDGLEKARTRRIEKREDEDGAYVYSTHMILDSWREILEDMADIVGEEEYESTIAPLFTEKYAEVLPDIIPEAHDLGDISTGEAPASGESLEMPDVQSDSNVQAYDGGVDIPSAPVDTGSFEGDFTGGGGFSSSSITTSEKNNGREKTFEGLRSLLENKRAEKRIEAINGLKEMETPSNYLADLLINSARTDVDQQVRFAAMNALGEWGGIKAIVGLKGVLEKANGQERLKALTVLGSIGSEHAIKVIVDHLAEIKKEAADPSTMSNLKKKIYDILGTAQGDLAKDALESALEDSDANIRIYVIRILSRIGAADSITRTIRNDDDPHVRLEAVKALKNGKGYSAKSVDVLIEALNDPDANVRKTVTNALGVTKAEEAAEKIVEVTATDDEQGVRLSAIKALGEIGNHVSVFGLVMVLAERSGEEKRSAIETLGRVGNDNAIDVLEAVLRNGDRESRMLALEALNEIDKPYADEALISGLKNDLKKENGATDQQITASIVDALGGRRVERALPYLAEALKNSSIQIRAAAAIAVEKIMEKEGLSDVSKELQKFQERFTPVSESDLTRQRISLAEALHYLSQIVPSLQKNQYEMYPLLQTALKYLPKEGVSVFISDRLPAINDYVSRIGEDLENIQHVRAFVGFIDADTKKTVERSLTVLAQVFGADSAMVVFGDKKDFSYSLGLSEEEVAQYYDNGNAGTTTTFLQQSITIKSAHGLVNVTIILGRTPETIERLGEYPDNKTDLQHMFDSLLETQSPVWIKAYDQVMEKYKDYQGLINRLQNAIVKEWDERILPDLKQLQSTAQKVQERERPIQSLEDLLKPAAIHLNDLINETTLNGFPSYRGKKEPTNIVPIIQERVAFYQDLAAEKGLSLETDLAMDESTTLADPLFLQRVVDIVLDNAFRFTDAGRISVKLSHGSFYRADIKERAEGIILEIADTGNGLPREKKEDLIDAARGNANNSNGNQSKGLDYVVKVIRSMNGNMWPISESGNGTTMKIFFPEYKNGDGIDTIADDQIVAQDLGSAADISKTETVASAAQPARIDDAERGSTVEIDETHNGGVDLTTIQSNLKVHEEMKQFNGYEVNIEPFLPQIGDIGTFMGYSVTIEGIQRITVKELVY